MKIARGSGRVVLLLGRYAFKFPRIHYLLKVVKATPKLIVKGQWWSIYNNAKWGWSGFYKGIRQNRTEYRCWKSCRAPFLVATYVSIGLVNVQKLQHGQQPSRNEMNVLFWEMTKQTANQVLTIDPHCFEPKNFLKSDGGYWIVDYGDGSYQPLRFTDYIIRWQRELALILCATNTPPA